MAKHTSINVVFDYINPISSEQVAQRSFVNRLGLRDRLANEALRSGLLIVSGYSSIGKTTLINLATDKRYLKSVSAPFTSVMRIQIDDDTDGQLLKVIYNDISAFTSGRKPDTLTATSLANIIHTNHLLIIIDGI